MHIRSLWLVTTLALGACASAPPPAPPPEPAPPPLAVDDSLSETSAAMVPAVPETPPKPVQTERGRFRVGVVSVETLAGTVPWVRKLQAAGYRADVWEVNLDGKVWQRVVLPGYETLEEARAVIPFVEEEFGLKGVWVTSRRRAPVPEHRAAPAAAPAAMSAEPEMPAETEMPAEPDMPAEPVPAAPGAELPAG